MLIELGKVTTETKDIMFNPQGDSSVTPLGHFA